MAGREWTKSILLKYILFQVPSFLIITTILIILNHWYHFGYLVIMIVFCLWILKDVLMFPVVWKAYENRAHKVNWKSKFYNTEGVVIQDLDPTGYIRIHGELWKAQAGIKEEKISKEDKVVVMEIHDNILIVHKSEN